jgi:hypothetical protein
MFDTVIRSAGVESFTAGSMSRAGDAAGVDILGEMNQIRTGVKKFADITRQCKKLALLREATAKDLQTQGNSVSARESYFIAAMLYGCARWSVWDDEDRNLLELTQKVTECYQNFAALSDHFIQKVEIPFEGKTLFGYLHIPPPVNRISDKNKEAGSKESPLPCVVIIPGMDTFKEESVRMYGDRFLQRGFAVLAVDGPGQGETVANGLKVTIDNYDRAGKAIADYLVNLHLQNSLLDNDRIAIVGASFGSYWGPRIMASDHRYVAGAFSNVCHEPHMETLFNGALPSFKTRHMWMCGIYDEVEFDEKYRSKLSLIGIGEKIVNQRIFIAGGQDDPLSPIENTIAFFKTIPSEKKKLLVYEGEEHGIADPLLSARMADFVMDTFRDKEMQSGAYFMERVPNWKMTRPIATG